MLGIDEIAAFSKAQIDGLPRQGSGLSARKAV